MHRQYLRFLCVCFLLSQYLWGCVSENDISFSCKVDNMMHSRGETVAVSVVVKNQGNRIRINSPIHNCFGEAVLMNGEYKIVCHVLTYSPANVRDYFQKGESVEKMYYFTIPQDAPSGKYSLSLSFCDITTMIDDVVSVDR